MCGCSQKTAEPGMTTTAAAAETAFSVPDMSCGHCEKAIRAALEQALPGAPVRVDLAAHRVLVAGDAARADAAIRAAGYTPERIG